MSASEFQFWQATDTLAHYQSAENIATALTGCGLTKASGGNDWESISSSSDSFSFTDSLQGTYPIHFELDYIVKPNSQGSGMNYRFTVSAGDNSIAMPVFNSGSNYVDQNNEVNCFASGDGSRIQLALCEGPNIFSYYFINIERSKDASGADTGDGVIVQCTFERDSNNLEPTDPATGVASLLIPFTGLVPGYQPTWNTAFNYNSATLNNASKIGTLQAIPFNFIPYLPGLGVLLYYGTDFPVYTAVSLPVYGANHTYLPLQNSYSGFGIGGTSGASGPSGNPAMHILMRYE